MLQAMNTGHDGSMSTIHANTPRDALTRIENMVGMAGHAHDFERHPQPDRLRDTLIVQVQRLPGRRPPHDEVSEITGMEGDVIQMHEIFKFVKDFTDGKGTLHGSFKATGIRPRFLADLRHTESTSRRAAFDPSRNL